MRGIVKIGIIGGGSIGLLLSSFLSKYHEVHLYVRRQEQKHKINHEGILLNQNQMISSVKAFLLEEMMEEDLLIVCVKSNQLKDVLPQLKQKNEHTPLLFLQNGMGHIHLLDEWGTQVFLGVVEHGALRQKENHVIHTGLGAIKIAAYPKENQLLYQLVNSLHQSDFPVYANIDWKELLQSKLIINAVINPLTAIFEVKNGELLTNDYLRKMAYTLCVESTKLLKMNKEEQWKRIQKIAYATADNTSSMLVDIQSNRSTEIESITGYLLTIEAMEKPLTQFVYHAVKAKEMKG